MSDDGLNDSSRRPKSYDFVSCPEARQLQKKFHAIQKQHDQLITALLAAFHANDQAEFWRLNKELEPVQEQRERNLEALRRHIRSHHCQPHGSELP
jgi:hypothetical protein